MFGVLVVFVFWFSLCVFDLLTYVLICFWVVCVTFGVVGFGTLVYAVVGCLPWLLILDFRLLGLY